MSDDNQHQDSEEFSDKSTHSAIEEVDLSDHTSTPTKPISASETTVKKSSKFPKTEKLIPRFIRKRLGKSARPISLVLIVVVLAVVGSGAWYFAQEAASSKNGVTRFSAKTVAFKVVSTSPSKNQVNVPTTTAIAINFSQPVTASKLQGNLFVTPNVPGSFTQGKNSSQVIFTPNVPFAQGTKVQVMLNGSYQSKQGAKLGPDFLYGFTTQLPQDGVVFEDSSGLYSTVSSAQSGKQETYSLLFGQNVAPGVTVTLYKGDMNELLSTLVYSESTSDGYSFPSFVNQPIDTSSMQVLTSQNNLNNNSNFNITENSGIYLAVATDSKGAQLGYVWVDYSDFGILARQDDQKIVLDAQSLSTSNDIPVTVQTYNLLNSVDQLNSASVDGLTTITTPFTPSTDVIVASDGASQALVPLSILDSQGDIRVDQDLSTAQSIYAITDRPTYSTTDTVEYSGFVRQNQDALYQPSSALLHLYVTEGGSFGTPLASFTAKPDSNGMFSGSFTTSPSWLGSDSSDQFYIYSTAADGNPSDNVEVASFTVTSQANASSNITVSFAKTSYLPTDTIQATISGTNASGSPLANAMVDVHTFSEDYYENDPTANLADFDNVGGEVNGSPTTVKLNSSGQATYTVNVGSLFSDGTSQMVTVQANLHGQTSGAAGGASTIVHQGNGTLTFGSSRNAIYQNGTVVGRVYANNLDGSPNVNAVVDYSLTDSSNSTTYATGSVTTNSSGLAEISLPVPSAVQAGGGLELNAWTIDEQNNKIEANTYYYIASPGDTYDTSGAGLEDLDVSGSPSNISVGQKVNLVINSPSSLNTMVTFDRGRIYNPEMVQLNQGNNNFSFTVDPALAPSFTLTFNYFENGIYHSEGVQFEVSNPAQQASLTLTPSAQTVTANTATTVSINAKDSSGTPLQTGMIVDVVNEGAYNLYNQVEPDMFTSLYPLLPIMTSSSSSLSSIGSGGGGRCGGGGGGPGGFTNPIGTTLLWLPKLMTDSSGNASVSFTPSKGTWRVSVYSMDSNTVVGSASTTITAD